MLIEKKNGNGSAGPLAKVMSRLKSDYSVSIKIMCAGRAVNVLKMVSVLKGGETG